MKFSTISFHSLYISRALYVTSAGTAWHSAHTKSTDEPRGPTSSRHLCKYWPRNTTSCSEYYVIGEDILVNP